MKFLKRHQLVKQAPFKPKQTLTRTNARLVFFSLSGLFLLLIPINLYVSSNSLSETKKLQKDLMAEVKQKEQEQADGQSDGYSPLLERFFSPFIQTYMTLTTNNDELDKRGEALSQYVSSNVVEIGDAVNLGVTQTLVSKELYTVYSDSDFDVAVYKVVYQVESPVDAEREVKKDGKVTIEKYVDYKEVTQETLLNIPFKRYEGNKFKVVSLPYFTDEKSLIQEKATELDIDKTMLNSVSTEKTEELQEFITQFLSKYTSSDETDMQFYMSHPETLTGFEVTSTAIQFYKKNDHYVALLDVRLVDKETKNAHQEKMTLVISQKEKTFNVDQLNHYLGGF